MALVFTYFGEVLNGKAIAAVFKGTVMAAFGVGVLAEAIYKMTAGVVPVAETMGIIGLLVLLGNGLCFLLLFRHRSDDLNMRSTWLCSRNDIVANGRCCWPLGA